MIKETFSPEETFAFGKWIGENALPGRGTGDHRACKQSDFYHYSGI